MADDSRSDRVAGNEYAANRRPSSNGELSLSALVESVLFVADGPTAVDQIARALGVTEPEVEAALAELDEAYGRRGVRLQRWQGRVQLTTAPRAAEAIERFLGLERIIHLSHAGLETLAIVAYQQPVTRPQIEAIRGVNSDSALKSLLAKGLIEELGRTDGPGRPILYGTTPEFLQHFGLASLAELPALDLSNPSGGASPEPRHSPAEAGAEGRTD